MSSFKANGSDYPNVHARSTYHRALFSVLHWLQRDHYIWYILYSNI